MTQRRNEALRLVIVLSILALVVTATTARLTGLLESSAVERRAGAAVALRNDEQLSSPRAPVVEGTVGPDRPLGADPDPTGSRRLWFAHGRWWAIFASPPDAAHHIWTRAGADAAWVDTGTVVDARPFAAVTTFWNGTDLLVAASGPKEYRSHGLRVTQFDWDADVERWLRAPDFPVEVTRSGAPDAQMVTGADGRIWLARMEGDKVVMARSDAARARFSAFEPIPGGVASRDVGNFSLIADAGKFRLVWRSSVMDELHVATGDGTTWDVVTRTVRGAAGNATIEAASPSADDPIGVLVLVETSLAQRSANESDPSVVLVSMRGERADVSVVARVSDRLRTPNLVIDRTSGAVHVISVVAPPDDGFGAASWLVSDKVASPPATRFAVGVGDVLVRQPVGSLERPMVPAAIDAESGLVLAASGPDLRSWYVAARGAVGSSEDLAAAPTRATVVHDTFDRFALGTGAPTSWFDEDGGALLATVVAEGDGAGRALSVTNRNGGPARAACRALPVAPGAPVTVRAVVTSTGRGTADTRLLTVRGPEGTIASARTTRKGMIGYAGPDGRVEAGVVADGARLVITVRIDPGTGQVDLTVEGDDGVALVDASGIAALSDPGDGPEEVCFTPAPGNPEVDLTIADLEVVHG